jgi:3-oxoacyl-[acyl-carrier protein] reductase
MNKTILITGSARGIGKAIALRAAREGYKVIVHGKTDSEQLRKTHAEIEGSDMLAFDVSDKDATLAVILDYMEQGNKIDVLVNNAGVARNFVQDIADVDDASAVEEFRINILGTIHCTQAVLPSMLARQAGCVINISSIKGIPNLSTLSTLTFATTKAGVISLTKSLAKSYSASGVRFNVVCPGYIETDQVKLWNKETFDRINNGTIFGRMGQPKEVAGMVMFLASDDASYITGTEFLVDGGYAIKGK